MNITLPKDDDVEGTWRQDVVHERRSTSPTVVPWKREGNCQVTTGDDVAYAVVAGAMRGSENVGVVRRKRVVPTSSSMVSTGAVSRLFAKGRCEKFIAERHTSEIVQKHRCDDHRLTSVSDSR